MIMLKATHNRLMDEKDATIKRLNDECWDRQRNEKKLGAIIANLKKGKKNETAL